MASSAHHCFSSNLACEFGVYEAIVIHHFQYWISINARKGSNFKDGKTWSYQTRREVQASLPYLTFDQVRDTCEKLVKIGVLINKNYNKSKVDKTLWYAFCDETQFGIPDNLAKFQKKFTKGELPSREGEIPFPEGEIPTPIPDPIRTSNEKKKDIKSENPSLQKGRAHFPKIHSADAESLSQFFIKKIRERHPKFKDPDMESWAQEMDLLLKLDNRSVLEVEEVISWSSSHPHWKKVCIRPSNIRKWFDEIWMQIQASKEEEIKKNNERENSDLIRKNKEWASKMKQEYPKEMSDITFSTKAAYNNKMGKDVSFLMPSDRFREILISITGYRNNE